MWLPPSRSSFRAYFTRLLQKPLTRLPQALATLLTLTVHQTKAVGTAVQGHLVGPSVNISRFPIWGVD